MQNKKVVVITGASSGIGKNLAQRFLAQNHTVIDLSRNDNNDFEHYNVDVSNELSVKDAINSIIKKYKKIDMLINCAGYGLSGATELIENEQAHNIFEVNYFGTLNCIRFSLPAMNNAKIINISSACALFALPFRSHYCASKSAISMLTDCLRLELSGTGIQIMQICPGDIKTNFGANRVKDFKTNERYGARVKNAADKIDKRYDKRMSVDYACDKIFKAITKPKLKPMVIIGTKYKLLYFASKIFSKKTMLYFTNKLFGGKDFKEN